MRSLTSIILVLALETCYACSKVFTSKSGVIDNPKVPHQPYYPDNANCTYTIIGSASVHNVHFMFETFELEPLIDILYIDNQMYTGGIPAGFSTAYYFNNYITLRFTSDGSIHGRGFRIRYRLIQDISSTIYTAQTGVIESPTVTNSSYYPNNACYLYTIRVTPHTQLIQFLFETLYLETNDDFLYLVSEKLTGNKTGYADGYKGHNNISLLFTSDGTINHYAGFKIRYWMITDCRTGYYGLNCLLRCSSGCSDVCNKETGSCNCKVGWTGAKCNKECPPGTYDSYCTKVCSPKCVNGSCNKEDGSCSCRPGYTGANCRHECQAGHYGQNCTSRCSSGCSDDCDKQSGRCTCKPGWTDTKCETECPPGTYDSYCTKSCSPGCVDGSCSKKDGKCSHKPTDVGDNRNNTPQNVKLIASVAAGGSLGFILLVSALICIVCFLRKKRAKHEATPKKCKDMELDQPGGEAVYDMPIDEEESRKRTRYEGLKHSTGQKFQVAGDVDNETEYVNVSFPKQKRAKKAVRGGNDKRKQCYENYAMESKERNK